MAVHLEGVFLFVFLDGKLAVVVVIHGHLHRRWLRHASVAEAVKNVHVGEIGVLRRVLKHGVDSAW